MHTMIALFTVLSMWRLADRANWRKYQATMLYITACGLLYEFLVKEHRQWMFIPDPWLNEKTTVMLHAFITMPISVFIFLSRFPDLSPLKKKILYYVQWIIMYASVEYVFYLLGFITYRNEWSYFHSVLFDCMMFPMLKMHDTKPLRAYILSIFIIIILMQWMDVPF